MATAALSRVQNRMIHTVLQIDDTRFLTATLKDIERRWMQREAKRKTKPEGGDEDRFPTLAEAVAEVEAGKTYSFDTLDEAYKWLDDDAEV